ncbi:MAG: Fe-S oxidoreductase [Peptococcaceae bacterium BICA1-8]|nr:MAG: Fe-S oxidoreductase [Peptococcaceae bacterium BICA1-8]
MKRFRKVYIEITNACNLACSYCPPTKRKPEYMKIENFTKILNEIKPYTDLIFFHVKGEPLLHPEIDTFLDLSNEKGFKVNLTTNGTLINKAQDKILDKPALRQINFSLHSLEGNKGLKHMDNYINDILTFIKTVTKETNIIISLRLWNLEGDNNKNLEKQRNAQLLATIEKEFDIPYKIEEKVIPGGGIKIAERVYVNQDQQFHWPDLKEAEDEGKGFCYGLRNQVAILVDGTVVPCCLDGEGVMNLGNINKTHFSEIIKGERANKLYQGFSRRDVVEELCRKCGYRKKFS